MSSDAPSGDGFAILPISMPSLPSFPMSAVHEIRIRRNAPQISSDIDGRSLFLKNVPTDSTEAHFRAIFASLVGPGRFESIAFEDQRKRTLDVDPASAAKVSAFGKKRKRGEVEEEERARQEEAALLPEIWTRRAHKSGSSAIVVMADEKSVDLALKAIAKTKKSKKPFPVWGEGVSADVPQLGSEWISSHLRLSRCDKTATQKAVHAFFTVFNRKEKEAADAAKRMRNEPDEDGFVTVTRGARTAPASKNEADAARQRMADRQAKKKDETQDFYRFQLRERRKAEQAALQRRFDEDRKKVSEMKEKRGNFRPET